MPGAPRSITIGGLVGLGVGVLLIVGAVTATPGSSLAQQPAGPPTPTPLSLETLSQVQPGLSTYMMEVAQRFGIMWFAAQQQNWDLAAFEGREAASVLQHGRSDRISLDKTGSTRITPIF
jgi:hypothetical protein